MQQSPSQQTAHYRRSQTIDAPADRVFDYVAEVSHLPTYLPPITSAQGVPPDKVRLQGEVPGQGTIDGEGYYHVHRVERRMEWGANVGRDYAGQLTVADQGAGRSELTVELSFGPRSVQEEVQQQSSSGRDPIEEHLGATLESIRRTVEGEGGKVAPPPAKG